MNESEIELSYKIVENGYEIYRDNDPNYGSSRPWITQYEPYIPNKELSYEENAKLQIEELKASIQEVSEESVVE